MEEMRHLPNDVASEVVMKASFINGSKFAGLSKNTCPAVVTSILGAVAEATHNGMIEVSNDWLTYMTNYIDESAYQINYRV